MAGGAQQKPGTLQQRVEPMEYSLPRLILFDVDQTLVSIRGGDVVALNAAFKQVHGIAEAFREFTLAGGLDLPLMIEAYRKWGIMTVGDGEVPDLSEFKTAYFEHLARTLETWTKGVVCPGVPDLLEALAADSRVQLGLETGNFRESAFIKLHRYGLDVFFEEGGFGGDHFERRELVASAIAKCQEWSGRTYSPGEIFLVGDTPNDIEAGWANEVRTLAVGTGNYSVEELERLGPTYVLPDLTDTERVLGLLLEA